MRLYTYIFPGTVPGAGDIEVNDTVPAAPPQS